VGVLWVLSSNVWLWVLHGLGIGLEEMVIEVKSEIVIITIVSLSILIVIPVVSPVVM